MPIPPVQPEQPNYTYPYPQPHQPARPATQLSHKTQHTQSERPNVDTQKPEPSTMNSFVNRVMDSLRNITLSETLPIATLFGAVLMHHLHHRKSKELVPYQTPRWVKYAKNAVFAYHCYGFAKNNGFIKSTPRNIRSASREVELNPMQNSPEVMDRSLEYNVSPQSMATGLLQGIVTSLFRSKATMELTASPGIQDFDNSWAVPRPVAENYYHYVYYDHASLHNANAILLGGAAAIKALRSQDSVTGKITYDGKILPYNQEHLLLDLALSETNQLLLSKSEVCALGDDDTLEYVGKIALATIIKIKMDEETASSQVTSQPQEQLSQASNSRYNFEADTQRQGSQLMPQAPAQTPNSYTSAASVQQQPHSSQPPSYTNNSNTPSDDPTVYPGHSAYQMGNFGQPAYNTQERNYTSAPAVPMQPVDAYAGPQPAMPMPQAPQPAYNYNPFTPFEAAASSGEERHRLASKRSASSSSSSSSSSKESLPANTYANRFKAIMRAVTISEVGPMILLVGGMLAHHYKNRNADKLIPYQMPKWIRYLKNMLFTYNAFKSARNNGLIKTIPQIRPTWPQETGKRGLAPKNDAVPPPLNHRGLTDHDPYQGGYGSRDLQHEMPEQPPQSDIVMQMVNALVGQLYQDSPNGNGNPDPESGVLDGFDHSWAVPQELAKKWHHAVYVAGQSLAHVESHFLGGAAAIHVLKAEKQMLREEGPNASAQLDSMHEYRVMGMALSEVDLLIERKADLGALSPQDNLEHVGKVALATIIKIKAEKDALQASRRRTHHSAAPTVVRGYDDVGYEQHDPYAYAASHRHPSALNSRAYHSYYY
ncbi:hypothetical protein IWW36_002126 [Coemansia brasiliensis]|uniref:Uncharacterized protein n=1 Tax=Coemansia brasiliensis TaxID=2650707 RepID=A0A9W8I8I1_9FUNG|nr:hypothetical protein IWW36_002126 [Coemansia brasiliensis]